MSLSHNTAKEISRPDNESTLSAHEQAVLWPFSYAHPRTQLPHRSGSLFRQGVSVCNHEHVVRESRRGLDSVMNDVLPATRNTSGGFLILTATIKQQEDKPAGEYTRLLESGCRSVRSESQVTGSQYPWETAGVGLIHRTIRGVTPTTGLLLFSFPTNPGVGHLSSLVPRRRARCVRSGATRGWLVGNSNFGNRDRTIRKADSLMLVSL